MNRREFVARLALGTLSVPLLLQTLGTRLKADEIVNKEKILWIRHHFSGIHSHGVFDHPEFVKYLSDYFHITSDESFFNDEKSEKFSQGMKPVVILEGVFPNLTSELRKKMAALFMNAKAVVLLGNEAAFTMSDEEQAGKIEKVLQKTDVAYIKLPGFPVDTKQLLGTLNHLFLYGVPDLDSSFRPEMFFSKKVCDHCEYRKDFEKSNFVKSYGQGKGCLFRLGCKGPFTYNDCPVEKKNESGEWCVSVGSPCTGCSEASYPNHAGVGLFDPVNGDNGNSVFVNYTKSIAKGVLAVTAAGVAVHAISKRTPLPLEEKELDAFYGEEDFNE